MPFDKEQTKKRINELEIILNNAPQMAYLYELDKEKEELNYLKSLLKYHSQ